MNDPHVVALIYGVKHGDSDDYDKAATLVREEKVFRLRVKDKLARFEMIDHFATAAEAREAVEEYIRVWEFDVCLRRGPDSFRLEFQTAEIEDRNPPPPSKMVRLKATACGVVAGSVRAGVSRAQYPAPPAAINMDPSNPDVQTMYQRYTSYRRGHEPLASMVYFCLTVFEYSNGGSRKAVKECQIAKKVLNKIGNLCNNKGGRLGARKAVGITAELTNPERRFLEEAVRTMIRRAAEKAHDPDKKLPMVCLSDLPPI